MGDASLTKLERKLLNEIIPDLNNIARAIEDEGDRSYFGSTNDADELREIARWLDGWRASLTKEPQDHD